MIRTGHIGDDVGPNGHPKCNNNSSKQKKKNVRCIFGTGMLTNIL